MASSTIPLGFKTGVKFINLFKAIPVYPSRLKKNLLGGNSECFPFDGLRSQSCKAQGNGKTVIILFNGNIIIHSLSMIVP